MNVKIYDKMVEIGRNIIGVVKINNLLISILIYFN